MLDSRAAQSVEPTKDLQAEAYARAWDSLSSLVAQSMRLREQLQELDKQRQQQQAAQNGNGAASSVGATQFDFPPMPPPDLSARRSNQETVRTSSAHQPSNSPVARLERAAQKPIPTANPSSQKNSPNQYAQSNLSGQFQGVALITKGIRQIVTKLFTSLSKGISLGGKNRKSLAEELTQHNLTSRFADKVLAFNGHQQSDGSLVAQGSNYRFSRDASGAVSIADVREGGRGEIFSSKNGFTLNQLTQADLKEFAKASKAISSFQQQQKQSSSQGIEP